MLLLEHAIFCTLLSYFRHQSNWIKLHFNAANADLKKQINAVLMISREALSGVMLPVSLIDVCRMCFFHRSVIDPCLNNNYDLLITLNKKANKNILTICHGELAWQIMKVVDVGGFGGGIWDYLDWHD